MFAGFLVPTPPIVGANCCSKVYSMPAFAA
jgi:hypothetical protein